MNDNERDAAISRAAIEDQAVEWLVKMRGEEAEDLRPAFEAWLARSSAHSAAYDWAEAHFVRSGRLKDSKRHGIGRFMASRKWLLTAAAASALLLLFQPQAGFGPFEDGGDSAWAAQPLESPHGEIRSYDLSDGSKVTLDSGSRVEVAMTPAGRRVKLREGKARFAVVRDRRPFVVEAGAGAVRADEAVFDVGYGDGDQIEVSLVSGRANVRPLVQTAAYSTDARVLPADRSLRYSVRNFRPMPVTDSGANRHDWPSGWVEYRSVTLRCLIAEANRYARKPIILDDMQIGNLTASGRFKLTDTEAFVARIAELFDLQASPRADGLHLHQR